MENCYKFGKEHFFLKKQNNNNNKGKDMVTWLHDKLLLNVQNIEIEREIELYFQ